MFFEKCVSGIRHARCRDCETYTGQTTELLYAETRNSVLASATMSGTSGVECNRWSEERKLHGSSGWWEHFCFPRLPPPLCHVLHSAPEKFLDITTLPLTNQLICLAGLVFINLPWNGGFPLQHILQHYANRFGLRALRSSKCEDGSDNILEQSTTCCRAMMLSVENVSVGFELTFSLQLLSKGSTVSLLSRFLLIRWIFSLQIINFCLIIFTNIRQGRTSLNDVSQWRSKLLSNTLPGIYPLQNSCFYALRIGCFKLLWCHTDDIMLLLQIIESVFFFSSTSSTSSSSSCQSMLYEPGSIQMYISPLSYKRKIVLFRHPMDVIEAMFFSAVLQVTQNTNNARVCTIVF